MKSGYKLSGKDVTLNVSWNLSTRKTGAAVSTVMRGRAEASMADGGHHGVLRENIVEEVEEADYPVRNM